MPTLRVSDEISSPVTFGFRAPGDSAAGAISGTRHVRCRTPSCATKCCTSSGATGSSRVGEELVRAIFWFHPAIWWLLGEIQLAREQAVDRAVIELTQSRDEYVDALLAIAGAKPQARSGPGAAVPAQEASEAESGFDFEGGKYVENEIDFRARRGAGIPGRGVLVCDGHLPAGGRAAERRSRHFH